MKLGLVLGGGGLIGMGYHAGALKALDEFGIDPTAADIMVGTSAGSIMASYMRTGWTPTDFVDYAHGRHPDSESKETAIRDEVRRLFVPMWSNSSERIRRMIGSGFAAMSSRGYWGRFGGKVPGSWWRRNFPAGMYSTDETRERLAKDLPQEWPDRATYICATDLYTGELVPFGREGSLSAPLPDAVLASTAIPAVFPPVRINDRRYVDGGVTSATSLDLAAKDGCDAIICIAPLGYRRDETPRSLRLFGPMIVRSMFARTLRKEVTAAREEGKDVLVIRPWLAELGAHGTNSMRHFDRAALVNDAREGVLRLLENNPDHPAIKAWMKHSSSRRSSDRKERTG
jgi:NTE family protein